MAGRKLALITGASSGIGLELARVFGQNGYDLIVNSEDDGLRNVATELNSLGVSVLPVQSDLSTYDGVEKLWNTVEQNGRALDAAAINAGVGAYGDFARESDLNQELKLIDLNVKSTVHLAKRVLGQMTKRGEGAVLFTSSIAGSIPAPLEAVYAASKAFILSFSESLHSELKDTGIKITALQPGPTNTNFFHRAGMDHTRVGSEGKYTNDPAKVAKQGYEALMANKDHVFAESAKTKFEGAMSKVVPDSVSAEMHRKQAEPKEKKSA